MKTVTFANQKGGCGKTTSACVLASGLSKIGHKVLLVDTDPQCNAALGSGADILAMDKTLYDVFKGSARFGDLIQKTDMGYGLVTGGLALAGADMEFTQTGREYMLREALEPFSGIYDYCVIDTAPSLGIITVNALTASDGVIIPLTPDLYSLQGLSQLNLLIERVKKYSNSGLKTEGLLITRYDGTNLSKAMREQIYNAAKSLKTKVFSQPIRNSVAVRESQLMKADLLSEAPRANATKDYTAFINEFLEGENNGKEK